ncbi:MAG: acylphosphatase [Clostridiales bacterium]|nr:acylphosphatase [Clostridiales bacterium]
MKTLKMIVTGRVQGVGFRYYIYKLALKLDVKGTVRNLDDGSVEIICTTDHHEHFIAEIKRGNGFSRVENIQIESIDPNTIAIKHLNKFTII